jgi:hypothetical protein
MGESGSQYWAIVALSPVLTPVTDLLRVDDATVRKVLNSWDRANSTPRCSWMEKHFATMGNLPQR